jgi:hypothetical protein
MTHLHVKPAWSVPPGRRALDPSLGPAMRSGRVAPRVTLLKTQDRDAGAVHDKAATLKLIRNPLWIIVMGMAWLLGIAASIMVVAEALANGFANGQ